MNIGAKLEGIEVETLVLKPANLHDTAQGSEAQGGELWSKVSLTFTRKIKKRVEYLNNYEKKK